MEEVGDEFADSIALNFGSLSCLFEWGYKQLSCKNSSRQSSSSHVSMVVKHVLITFGLIDLIEHSLAYF